MDDDEIIELTASENGGERVYEYRSRKRQVPGWKSKLIFWAMAIGGIAIGTILFLFFISLFVYLFPVLVVAFVVWFILKSLGSK